jgi:tetratricopeptide (TPR) repeat protein
VYIAGFVGALFAAFANTVAFCSVEAEVNQPLLLPIALTTWLALVWAQSKDPKRDRLLLLIAYISFLGVGIHMYSMIVMAPIFLFVVLVDRDKLKDWRIWTTSVLIGLVMYDIVWFIWLALALIIVNLCMSFADGRNRRQWRFVFWLSVFAILGFSCHLYIPIRSALNPMIDENHPAAWRTFQDYLNRKQYGSETMVERMFWRRGTAAHQFGIEGNMGYGGFHLTQFFHFSLLDTQNDSRDRPYLFSKNGTATGMLHLLIYLIPTGFMLFGFYFLFKRYRTAAILLISLELLTGVGLVFYMNFADGTKPEKRDYAMWVRGGGQGPVPVVHREVRVRDYFWVAGFMYFGMWMGLAAGGTLYVLFTNKRRFLRATLAPIAGVLFAVSPALPFSQNIPVQSRRGNFAPFDYAYNLLMSCDKDGILITNGDNDTFPLWALQEAYGIRRDVRIVNLSLLNTNWYCKQMKNLEPRVPISFSDAQIDALNAELNPFIEPMTYTMENAHITVTIPSRKQQEAMRVQDKMVLNFVDANQWRKPLYFAVTVSEDNFMGLDPYLQMQGLVYRVMPHPVAADKKVDADRMLYFLEKVYRFRGLGDGTANLDETAKKLLSNYAACFIQAALSYRAPLVALRDEITRMRTELSDTGTLSKAKGNSKAGRVALMQVKQEQYAKMLDRAVGAMDKCITLMPADWRPRTLLQEFLVNHNRLDEAEKRARQALLVDPDNTDYLKMLAQTLELRGKRAEANEALRRLVANDPDPIYAYAALAKNYENGKLYDSAIAVMEEFRRMHPDDKRGPDMIARWQALKNKKSSR